MAALISNGFCVVLVLILLNDLEFYCLVRVGKKQCGPLLLAHVLNLNLRISKLKASSPFSTGVSDWSCHNKYVFELNIRVQR